MALRNVCTVLATAALLSILMSCESTLLSKVVDVEQDGVPPPVLFARLTTADTTWRVFLFEGSRPNDDDFAATLAGATVTLGVGDEVFGPFALQSEKVYEGFPIQQDTFTTPFVRRDVYALPAPRPLTPGETVTLDVELPGGPAFVLSQKLPLPAGASLFEYQPAPVDTQGVGSQSFEQDRLIVKLSRPESGTTNYYRIRARQTFYREGAVLFALNRFTNLSTLEEDDTEILASGIFSDARAAADSVQQNVSVSTRLSLFFWDPDDDEESPLPDSSVLRLTAVTMPEASVDYYTELQRARRSAGDFFSEPVVLASQTEVGVIAHLVLETVGEAGVIEVEVEL